MQPEYKNIFINLSKLLLVYLSSIRRESLPGPERSQLLTHSSGLPALCCHLGQLQGMQSNAKLAAAAWFVLHFMQTFITGTQIKYIWKVEGGFILARELQAQV